MWFWFSFSFQCIHNESRTISLYRCQREFYIAKIVIILEMPNGQNFISSNFELKIFFYAFQTHSQNILTIFEFGQNLSDWCPIHANSLSIRTVRAILFVGQPNSIYVGIFLKELEKICCPFAISIYGIPFFGNHINRIFSTTICIHIKKTVVQF